MAEVLSENRIDDIVEYLRQGEIVIIPTSRWYMTLCDADNDDLCKHVFMSKQRPLNKPLLTVMPTVDMAESLCIIPQAAKKLTETFWPGDLFLELKWKDSSIELASPTLGTTSALVNVPNDVLGRICRLYNKPLASTAVSLSVGAEGFGQGYGGPCISVSEVETFIKHTRLDARAILDGGICPSFQHGTIVDGTMNSGKLTMVREGTIHVKALNAALGGSYL